MGIGRGFGEFVCEIGDYVKMLRQDDFAAAWRTFDIGLGSLWTPICVVMPV